MGEWVAVNAGAFSPAPDIAFESFGVRVGVHGDTPEVCERILALLPPHATPCDLSAATESFAILSERDGSYRLERGNSPVTRKIDLELALLLLESQLRIYVGLNAPGKIFVHAGVVEYGGYALVVPGLSFAGKTVLVTALVRAGARYYSDEFSVIDEAGLVHPFAKPLSIRDGQQVQRDRAVEQLGGTIGTEQVPIGAVVFTEYRPGASWKPQSLSHGRGVLAMLEHTLPVRERHEEALRVLRKALDGATLMKGERGEADEIAEPLLRTVSGAHTRAATGATR